jgi:hypothetical protein
MTYHDCCMIGECVFLRAQEEEYNAVRFTSSLQSVLHIEQDVLS